MTSRPSPGPGHPLPATPRRAHESRRRTTSLDITRPDGLAGRVVADIRGHDVHTAADGLARVVERLTVAVEIDPRRGEVLAITGLSTGRPLSDLVGTGVRSGFGRRVAELLPDEAARRSLLYSALDDLGGALLVSGYALLRNGVVAVARDRDDAELRARAQADVCTGWASGGPVLDVLRETGLAALPMGPAAPAIDGDDTLGWHRMAPPAPETVRRRRRLDVTAAPGGAGLQAQAHFRDSYAAPDGEMVLHEYVVDAHVDGAGRLARVDVDPRVLPWRACPGAATSAQGLLGAQVRDIPARVRADLVGVTTCTHLNSTLRSLADLPALAGS